MPASDSEVRSFKDEIIWKKNHLSLSAESETAGKSPDLSPQDLNNLFHEIKCKHISTEGNDISEALVPNGKHDDDPKGHIVYSVADKEKPTLDAFLGSIPVVYNSFTKQLELEHSNNRTKPNSNNFSCILDNGIHFPMENDHPSWQRDGKRSLPKYTTHNSESPFTRKHLCDVEENETLEEALEEAEKDDVLTTKSVEPNGSSEAGENPLPRSPTSTSLQHTDTSSFTSMSSVGTDLSFCVGEQQQQASRKASLCYSCDNLQCLSENAYAGAKPKKWGLSNSFLKNLLPWRFKTSVEDPEEEIDHTQRSPSACSSSSRKSEECVASSTTALILENRPANLPAKSAEEEIKHKQEYEEMIKGARKKELQDAKVKKKQAQQQQKLEEQLIQATKIWNEEILPNWNTMKDSRKTRDLWWKGLPPSVRGRIWKLAVGNDLNITQELYDICYGRSKEKIWDSGNPKSEEGSNENGNCKESAADFIKLDVSRTFPQLGIFQEGGPYHSILEGVLGSYVIYRPDIGYVQGMSFLAAMLLLNMEAVDTFVCFCNLLNRPCQLAFFRIEQAMMTLYYSLYEEYFKENLPKLFGVFKKQNLSPDLYLVDWLYTLFSKSLPLDVACRVWDVFLRDGEEFLFRTALGILRMYEDILINMDFIHLAQFLTRLPEDIDADRLFSSISAIRMTLNKKPFSQLLQQRMDSLSSSKE